VKVTAFIKFRRRLHWAGHVIRMEKHCIPKKALQQTIYSNRRIGKPRKRWEDKVRENAVMLLGIQPSKTKVKDEEFWRQRIKEAKA
jgi:hypothetical protein